jgi:hypothetical protein
MASTQSLHEVATLTALDGKGFVRHSDGTRSELVAGMKLSLGDIVITMPGGRASVQILDGRHFDLARSQGDAIKIDQTVLDVVTDIQDVRVTDLSLVYPYVAHHIVTDPTVDPLSLNNDDLSNDLSQLSSIDAADEPAAINDLGGGDLLSGNTYVVLNSNPIVTETTPFITEPGHFNHGFTPVNNPGFVPTATPLVHLLAEHAPSAPVLPAVDSAPVQPAYVPIITLSMASTTYVDPNLHALINNSGPIPVVDDEALALGFNVTTTNHIDPQTFNVMIFDLAHSDGYLLQDFDSVTGLPIGTHIVDPMSAFDSSNNPTYTDTFYVPISEGQDGQTISVKLVPTDFNAVQYSNQELSSAFKVGELGSETEISPASLHVDISAPTIDFTESADRELTAVYQVQLTDGSSVIHNDQPVAIHWILQNTKTPGIFVEGDVVINKNAGSVAITAAVPEEDPSDTSQFENYTLSILLDNSVVVTSGSQLYTINPITIPVDVILQSNLQNNSNQFLVAQNTGLQFDNENYNSSEATEETASAAFDTYVAPGSTLELDDDNYLNNAQIHFSINSSQLQNLLQNGGLKFVVNIYDVTDPSNLIQIGTLAQLDAQGHVVGNQADFYVPVDLSQFEDLPVPVDLHGKTLSFRMEADNNNLDPASINGVSLFTTISPTPAHVEAQVIDDSSYEKAKIVSIDLADPLHTIDNTNHGISIFSNNQVPDSHPNIFDENVQFKVDFDQQFRDATFDIVVHGPNNQTVETINIGTVPISGQITPSTSINGDLVYESQAPDGTIVDYVVHTDGTSSLVFFAALPNTEDSPQYTVSIEPTSIVGAAAPTDTNGNVIEDISALHISSVPYTLVPDVHVTATIDGLTGGAIDDEATVNVTLHLDHQLAQDTQYHVVIQSSDGLSQFYADDQTVVAGSSDFSFSAGQLTDSFENKDLVVTLTDITTGAVYFSGNANADAVKVNVVNDPTPVLVQDLVNDPIAITVTPPSTLIDEENPLQTTATFSYQVQGEFVNTALASPSNDPSFNWASVKFDVYAQALDSNNHPVGSLQHLAVDPITLDFSNLTSNFSFSGTFDIPISLLGDGHQQIVLEPQDASISALFPFSTTPFDVVDMSYQVITDSGSGIDTYVLVDNSDGTSTVVNPSTGNHIESLDLLQPQGNTTTFQLDFGDHVVAGTSADFNSNQLNSNPIDHLIFHSNGFIEFGSQEGAAITIDQTNLQQAIDYLAQNCKLIGATVEFNVDNNGVNNSYVFHQSTGGYNLVNVSDTAGVAGVDTQNFSQSTIHIVDHQ